MLLLLILHHNALDKFGVWFEPLLPQPVPGRLLVEASRLFGAGKNILHSYNSCLGV